MPGSGFFQQIALGSLCVFLRARAQHVLARNTCATHVGVPLRGLSCAYLNLYLCRSVYLCMSAYLCMSVVCACVPLAFPKALHECVHQDACTCTHLIPRALALHAATRLCLSFHPTRVSSMHRMGSRVISIRIVTRLHGEFDSCCFMACLICVRRTPTAREH